jgi:hypothetical protein
MKIEQLVSAIEKRISVLESDIKNAEQELFFEKECLNRILKLDIAERPAVSETSFPMLEQAMKVMSRTKYKNKEEIAKTVISNRHLGAKDILKIMHANEWLRKSTGPRNVRFINGILDLFKKDK